VRAVVSTIDIQIERLDVGIVPNISRIIVYIVAVKAQAELQIVVLQDPLVLLIIPVAIALQSVGVDRVSIGVLVKGSQLSTCK